jgi:hypothetical protein
MLSDVRNEAWYFIKCVTRDAIDGAINIATEFPGKTNTGDVVFPKIVHHTLVVSSTSIVTRSAIDRTLRDVR